MTMPRSKYNRPEVVVTDEREIASIRRAGLTDLVGVVKENGIVKADPEHLEKWRAREIEKAKIQSARPAPVKLSLGVRLRSAWKRFFKSNNGNINA
jgi:hypothetical protein